MRLTTSIASSMATVLFGCAQIDPSPSAHTSDAIAEVACPVTMTGLDHARCYAGHDDAGSLVAVVVPARWNGILVLHAHGGPFLGPPTMARVDEDLARWAVVPRAGYAWAATSYHQGGVAVRSAVGDIERLRAIALRIVGTPKAVLLHGQSWGGNVAAKAAELDADRHLFDGVLLTSGVLAGGPRAYEHRLNLRVVYQYLCGNHPLASEPAYPSWMGLPEDGRLTQATLLARADACLGIEHSPDQRTPEQARRLKSLLAVVHIPEASLPGELTFATFTFQDIARRYGWRSVMGNVDARYQGSDDDDALNAGVARYAADPDALRQFADDSDLSGRIGVPVLTMHAIEDPVAFVEMERRFGDRVAAAGHGADLVQTFSDDRVHSYVSDATYVALLDALSGWVLDGRKPTPEGVAEACVDAQRRYPSTCRFRPDYRPARLESRVTERSRP